MFHCFLEGFRPTSLFVLLEEVFRGFAEVFTKQVFICGFKYTKLQKHKCQLLNFVLGQAKMAVYVSRRRKVEGSVETDVKLLFVKMWKSGLLLDLVFYRTNQELDGIRLVWTHDRLLYSVEGDQLMFGDVLM